MQWSLTGILSSISWLPDFTKWNGICIFIHISASILLLYNNITYVQA